MREINQNTKDTSQNMNNKLRENIFENSNNKSIFNYITDNVNYKNKNECANYTPPFISYNPIGFPSKNTDVDSALKGINQYMSKCTEYKYRQEDQLNIDYKKNEKECDINYSIIPFGYMPFDKFKNNAKK